VGGVPLRVTPPFPDHLVPSGPGGGKGWKIRLWDFVFYLSFGVVITLAVPIAGVLMVFSFLVVPAVIANLFTADKRKLTIISWSSGALASILGLWLSYTKDLPTGPLVVCMFGLLLVLAAVCRKLGVCGRSSATAPLTVYG